MGHGQPFGDTTWKQLDVMVERVMAASGVPGISLAVTDREVLLTTRTYGYANVDAQEPAREATAFEAGSIGKSFTAIAFLQLEAEGKVDLQAPITRYLPWFEVQSEYEPITVHHLLTHTSGVNGGSDFVPGAPYEVWAVRRMRTFAAPGERFCYSNLGYKVLGLALEAIERKPYAQIIRERILDPLGMESSFCSITHEMRHHLAVGYTDRYDDRPSLPEDGLVAATWLETNTGDGCLAMNAADLATYLRALLNAGGGSEGTVLDADQFASMRYPHEGASPEPDYGYGLESHVREGANRFGHAGGMVGYSSHMLADLMTGYGVVVLCNAIAPTTEIATYALDLLAADEAGMERPALSAIVDDPYAIEGSEAFVGAYTDGKIVASVVAEGDRFFLQCDGERRPMRLRHPDVKDGPLVVDHPVVGRKVVRFGRTDGDDAVAEMYLGTRWLRHERYAGPVEFEVPPEWFAFTGHYRSHNPWNGTFRISIEKDRLVMEIRGHVLPLTAEGDGFLIYRGDIATERLEFDAVVDGQALVCRYASGAEYSRFFTP
ncbi:MAG TPA: serine hydrolase domain-containing protein [Thermomicrobiales bacterium]|nr:serine hydrolase domain-containing protein [Thermomicrobiales bacterium]